VSACLGSIAPKKEVKKNIFFKIFKEAIDLKTGKKYRKVSSSIPQISVLFKRSKS